MNTSYWLRAGLGWLAAVTLAMGLSACEDDGDNTPDPDAGDTGDTDVEDPEPDFDFCDPLNDYECSLPWPSNLYLEEDATRETGYTLAFGEKSLPRTRQGNNIAPDAYRRLDGYGVSTPIIFYFENLDISEMASESNVAPSVDDEDHQALLFVERDGELERVPFFIETDLQEPVEERRVTFMRPALILEEGARYIVALRNLSDQSGNEIEPSPAFAALLAGDTEGDEALEDRQARFDEIFGLLEDEGIDTAELDLAWDFVTASSESLHGPMLEMRRLALEAIGENGPELNITAVRSFQRDDSGAPGYNERVAFEVEGTFEAPYFMRPADPTRPDGGSVFNNGEDGLPDQNGTRTAEFWVTIPWVALDEEAPPTGLIQYGHGLNGKGSQVFGGFNDRVAEEYNYIMFGNDFVGMSSDDVPQILTLVGDFSLFPWLADRMHQGIIEFLVLGRSMLNRFEAAFEATAEAQAVSADIEIDRDRYFYSGISQGGIYGATVVAVSPDLHYGHLGVPGLNYSILLQRSVDFDPFYVIVRSAYRTNSQAALCLAAVQMLWDQVDPSSYIRHLSEEPFEDDDPSYVLFAPAKGDYQVSPMTNLIAARTNVGVEVMEGWGLDISHWGIQEQPYEVSPGENYTGSAVVMWDLGNPWPEDGNLPHEDELGDPHGIPRYFPEHQDQMIHFFESGGEVIDVCGGNGCNFRAPDGCGDRETCWVDD